MADERIEELGELKICARCGEETDETEDGIGEWDGFILCQLCYDDILFDQQEESGIPF